MRLTLYQIDAFTDRVFKGNPAAVVPLETWLTDETMQAIALENNLSETAFFVPEKEGFKIRWFTPKAEVDLCGHATLASVYVIFHYLDKTAGDITFYSNSGPLKAVRRDPYIQLDFPAIKVSEKLIDPPEAIVKAIDQPVVEVFTSKQDFLAVLETATAVKNIKPDLSLLETLDNRGVIYTAKGEDCDFVSRCFFPKYDVDEDPVTGSAHCVSAPYWSKALNKTKLTAKQLSARGGELVCEIEGDRVLLLGQAVPYMQATITI